MWMRILMLLGALVALSCAGRPINHGVVGEYGYYTNWRKTICEKNDAEVYRELDDCFKLEPKVVFEAAVDCMKEAAPSSGGDSVAFTEEACKDTKLFKKFDECFDEYEANSAFKKQMEDCAELDKCYKKVLQKYELGDFPDYFTDDSEPASSE